MKTQSGEEVIVHRDAFFGMPLGPDYYYENGARVEVNEGAGNDAPQRPTDYPNDR